MEDPLQQARKTLQFKLGGDFNTLRELNDVRRLLDFLVTILLFMFGTALINFEMPFATIIGILVNAAAFNMCVLLLHEGMHGTLFKHKSLNDVSSTVLGMMVGVSFTGYRKLHNLHHEFAGRYGDPDFYPGYAKNKYLLWFMYHLRIMGGAVLYIFLIPVIAWKKVSTAQRLIIVSESVLLYAVWGISFYMFPTRLLILSILVPLFVVSYFSAVRGFAEHSFVDDTDPLTGSRTVTGDPITNFLMLNINFHLAHHLFPEVPSYHLKKLHGFISPLCHRQTISSSYLGFLWQFFLASFSFNESPIGTTEKTQTK